VCLLIHVIIPCLNLGSDKSRAPASYPLRDWTPFPFIMFAATGNARATSSSLGLWNERTCCIAQSSETPQKKANRAWEPNEKIARNLGDLFCAERGTFPCGRRRTTGQTKSDPSDGRHFVTKFQQFAGVYFWRGGLSGF
jgi:hypothetical protein